jgi:DNA-binding beta-propeller fold protein YncE
MGRSQLRRSLTAVAAAALLAACSHGGARALPPALPGGSSAPSAAQMRPEAQAAGVFPLRQARAAVVKNRSAMSATPANCGTVVTKHFGTLTYAVRGTRFNNATVNAAGCDVGIFIGAGDGENDNGARVAFSAVEGASFAAILVTDGVDDVHIHDGTANGGIAGIAIDDATNVHVARMDIFTYASYGFLAEAGASYTVRQTNTTGSGAAGTSGAQAGFLMAGATQLDSANNSSRRHRATGSTPAYLIPSGATAAQSYGFFLCAVTDASGRPLTAAGTKLVTKNDTNGIALSPTCPDSAPTASPTPVPTPTPTPSPAPNPMYMPNSAGWIDVDDAATGALIKTINDPSIHNPAALALSGGKLYVTNADSTSPSLNTLSIFDTTNNNALVTVLSGNNMFEAYGLAVGNGKLFVANDLNSTVSVFDVNNGYAPLPPITGSTLGGVVGAAYANGKLYVANFSPSYGDPRPPPQTNNVSVFDTANNNALVAVIPGPETQDGLGAVAVGNGFLYVAGAWVNKVYVFDTTTNALVRTIVDPSINNPNGLAFANGKLYVSNGNGSGGVGVFDPANNYALVTVLQTRSVGNLVVTGLSVPLTR